MSHPLLDRIVALGKGNPGALHLLTMIAATKKDALTVFEKLEELSLTGPDIWIAYKDENGEDIDQFIEDVLTR